MIFVGVFCGVYSLVGGVGGIPTPLEKKYKSIGMISTNIWKNVPNYRPVVVYILHDDVVEKDII